MPVPHYYVSPLSKAGRQSAITHPSLGGGVVGERQKAQNTVFAMLRFEHFQLCILY